MDGQVPFRKRRSTKRYGKTSPVRYRLSCAIWEFTLKCNLRCTHCGSSAGIERPDELSTAECFSLCEQLATLGCSDVAVMGGEPFLREDYFSVGKCIKDLGMNLNFVSNGLLIPENIDRISLLEPRVVGISLDGMKESHERIRGSGTWEPALRAISCLRERGIQTTVITTVSKENFRDLPELGDLIHPKGVNWQLQTAMPFGNFKMNQTLSKQEFYASALFIAKQGIDGKFREFPVVGAHCYGYQSDLMFCRSWSGCTAGISTVGITSNGGVVGCLSLGNDRFIEGNIRTTDLVEMWNDPNRFKYTRGFDRSQLGENCSRCKHGAACKGGCNSVSYSLTGKLHNDPYCFHAIERADDMHKRARQSIS